MNQVLIRSSLATAFLALPACIFGQGQERAMEDAGNTLTGLLLIIGLAILLFLLLLLFRNKYLGYLNFISGLTLIIAATGKLPHYLLTNLGAEICITSGFFQMAFSVILGWIYQKHTTISPTVPSSSNNIVGAKSSKKEMTLNVVFLTFLLNAVYSTIIFYHQAEITFSLPQFFLIRILPLIILAATTYLFIVKTQTGWVLGAGHFISIVLITLLNQLSTIITCLKYSLTIPIIPVLYNAVYIPLLAACLFLVLSRSVKDAFRIKRSQIILALAAGLLLSVFSIYSSIQTTKMTEIESL
jgi:hypothetical protein